MATAKKLPSGSWRVRAYLGKDANGKAMYKSFTGRTKKEAEYLAVKYLDDCDKEYFSNTTDETIGAIVDKYLTVKGNILSQATIRGYLSIRKNLIEQISSIKVKDLKSANTQVWIGNLSVSHSPKTVHNAYGLLSAALEMFYPDKILKVQLPQKENKQLYVPTDDDIKMILNYFKEYDIDMYRACLLSAFGTLRRSELCALTADDVSGNLITINKALVKSVDGAWVLKTTKTTSSTRTVEFPQFVIDALPKEGRLVNISPSRVSDRFIKTLKKLNKRNFRFHDLRHYSASVMHAIGVPDVYIMERGGWKSDNTLKKIYRGKMDDYQKKFTDTTNNHFEKICHEI